MAGLTGFNMFVKFLPYLDYNRMWQLPVCHAIFFGVFKRFTALLYPATPQAKAKLKAKAAAAATALAAAATAAAAAATLGIAAVLPAVAAVQQATAGVQQVAVSAQLVAEGVLPVVAAIQRGTAGVLPDVLTAQAPAPGAQPAGEVAHSGEGAQPDGVAGQRGARGVLRANARPFVPNVMMNMPPEFAFGKEGLKSIQERSNNFVSTRGGHT